eukprot:TRINITY_DN23751_c0_g1_i1.p1 TRINITY_DN23751_c0_g1~~TRINITY_DN23751_c0_g1_i1.p1  ORF type:complete len:1257 (-),score=207.81 TRINITY_DN23751_c0_g1_i1:177-3947(-)
MCKVITMATQASQAESNAIETENREALLAQPVRLFVDKADPCVGQLHVFSFDHVGLFCRICELLTSHGMDICSADIRTEDGVVRNIFELHTSKPSDLADTKEWCQELQAVVAQPGGGAALEGSLASVSRRLSVNPDLLSVVSFMGGHATNEPSSELRYSLELEGINQAGLLTYTALVLCRCGFSVVSARISTYEGHVSDSFELSTTSPEAVNLLRSYLDVPMSVPNKDITPLPFHATQSDADLQALMHMWGKQTSISGFGSSPSMSRVESLNEIAEEPGRQSSGSDREELNLMPRIAETEKKLSTEGPSQKTVSLLSKALEAAREGASGRLLSPASSNSAEGSAQGILGNRSSRAPALQRQMSVQFGNGDVYTGSCRMFQDGEKRHGLGTYTYAGGSHEIYKQYSGQWREDKKHGYGVLFYRNGGVYVGQWIDNRKHGLGVLLDNSSSQGQKQQDAIGMPTYRYEGLWQEDRPHGLGAEECDVTSYFGHFVHGQRSGRGFRMNLAKMSSGCEVIDASSQAVPFYDALEAELTAMRDQDGLKRNSAPSGALLEQENFNMSVNGATYHVSHSSGSSARTSLADLPFRRQTSEGARGSGVDTPQESCENVKANTRIDNPFRGALRPNTSSADFGTPATPHVQAGALGFCGTAPIQPGSPAGAFLPGQNTPMECGGVHRTRASSHHAINGLQSAGSLRSKSSGSTSTSSQQAASGSGASVGGGSTPIAPMQGRYRGGKEEEVVFSLWEENNLLSPQVSLTDNHKLVDYKQQQQRQPIPEETCGNPCPENGRRKDKSRRFAHRSESDPWSPGALGPGADMTYGGSSSSTAANLAPAATRPSLQEPKAPVASQRKENKRDSIRPLIRKSPQLWSEDELSAFLVCLGINMEVCVRVRQQNIKGAAQLLEMSNSQLRQVCSLHTPVERLIVRNSLKRLLDADRWENSVCGYKAGDILSDSVLSRFIVPLEELTLVTKISQGGYGTVYRGILEPKVDRVEGTFAAKKAHPVAVKDMKGERRVQLFELLKEACVMASLKHPNICTFVGVSTDANARKHYIISELMDCSLFDIIHQPYKLRWHGELTVSLSLNLATGIMSGIVYIHAKNLVHADLKSSNILIDFTSSRRLLPRICDFGHAAVRSHPSPHHRCGTPHWAGPEVLRGEALGPRADIYSFGVIMWEMLAQKLPHKGLSFGQVLASVGWAGWTPEMSSLPELPEEVRQLIKDCLSFVPAERPEGKMVLKSLKRIPKQARSKAVRELADFLG